MFKHIRWKMIKQIIKKFVSFNFITCIIQIAELLLTCSFLICFQKFENDYKNLTDGDLSLWLWNNRTWIYVTINGLSIAYSYRTIIFLIMCIPFIFLFLFLLIVSIVTVELKCMKKILQKIFHNVPIFISRALGRFFCGSLDFFHLFFCFQRCMPSIIDDLQPILDSLSLFIDFILFFSIIVFGILLTMNLKPDGNMVPIILFYSQLIPHILGLIINIARFKLNLTVSARVRDIFRPDGMDSHKKAQIIVFEDAVGVKQCAFRNRCKITDPVHRVRYHKKKEIFKLDRFSESGKGNFVVGFHQTSIESARNIIATYMKESSQGMLGKGIYFATNMEATNSKATDKGAILVAEICLKKVEVLYERPEQSRTNRILDGFDTRYFHDRRDPIHDEFIIRKSDQIKQYVVVVNKKEAREYRMANNVNTDEA